MAALGLKGITKSFGNTAVLSPLDLDIADGEFLTLVGPSGCGKSTLLRIIAGLEPQTAGTVSIGGTPVDHLRPHERKVAMVFQNYALYPHMTVFDNIALPLTMARLSVFERIPLIKWLSPRRRKVMEGITRDVKAVAEQLRIEQYFDRRPAQLSGGQRQRVALGRAMVRHPDVFLMDEPLSNLDAKLRVHMRSELAELHSRLKATMIYVTHDQVEAMTMSDRLAVMDQGRVLQIGTPDEVYSEPATVTVAQFIGSPAINLLKAVVRGDGQIEVGDAIWPLRVSQEAGPVTVGIRPECVRLSARPGDVTLPAAFRRRENLGAESILHFETAVGAVLCKASHGAEHRALAPGHNASLALAPAECHVFDSRGQRIRPSQIQTSSASAALRHPTLVGTTR
ncbi:MAG TPA: ABC transporter ATP-binding protein [Pseudorhodoplanes sp.]|nr:ABC transporter ATP-binding protein [Pseudorhodoplanes sp.]